MPRILYLHGFASSPSSKKARIFAERFAALGIDITIPDLAEDNFAGLTISGQLGVIEREARGEPTAIIGSSLGGYLAALYASRNPSVERVVMMAPAFGFARRWCESLGTEAVLHWRNSGSLTVPHYGTGGEAQLGWQLIEDASGYEEEPAFNQPGLIFHGLSDDVVPVEASRGFASTHPNVRLLELDSDHELLNVVDAMWSATRAFLGM